MRGRERHMDEKIYFKVLKLFGAKGTRFTTDDLARELGTSKRTIYSHFTSKDEIIEKTIGFVFRDMHQADERILKDDSITLPEKLKLVLENIPDAYNLGAIIRHKDDLQRFYPDLWEEVNNHLNEAWEDLINLIEVGIQEQELAEVNTEVLRMMLNEALRKLLDYEYLAQKSFSFESGMKAMYDIILYGILKR